MYGAIEAVLQVVLYNHNRHKYYMQQEIIIQKYLTIE